METQKTSQTNLLIIPVDEEYGYRLWYWVYPGTEAELIKDWNEGKAPLNFFDPSKGNFRGKMVPAKDWDKWYDVLNISNISCDVHEDWDTSLQIGDKYFDHPFFDREKWQKEMDEPWEDMKDRCEYE